MRTSFLSLVKRFAREERGASFVEYALLVALVVAAIAGVASTLFTDIGTAMNTVGGAIQATADSANTAGTGSLGNP